MEYEYIFFRPGSLEDIAAHIYTANPLPGIDVGQFIMLESDGYSTVMGHNLEIVNIETVIIAPRDVLTKLIVQVYTRQRDRVHLLDSLSNSH